MARRSSLWKILAVVLVALSAMAVGAGLWVVSLRDLKWAAGIH